mgnify:CR=1 FL=1|jgi:hypothetical protein
MANGILNDSPVAMQGQLARLNANPRAATMRALEARRGSVPTLPDIWRAATQWAHRRPPPTPGPSPNIPGFRQTEASRRWILGQIGAAQKLKERTEGQGYIWPGIGAEMYGGFLQNLLGPHEGAITGEGVLSAMDLGGLGAAPPGSLSALIGRKATTFKPRAADRAENMYLDMLPEGRIWDETGTIRGPGRGMRQENPSDKGLKLKKKGVMVDARDQTKQLGTWLGMAEDVISHPQLERAYPGILKNMRVLFHPGSGGSLGTDTLGNKVMEIGLNTDASRIFYRPPTSLNRLARQTANHELQHVIQDLEDFPLGSSPRMFDDLPQAKAVSEKAGEHYQGLLRLLHEAFPRSRPDPSDPLGAGDPNLLGPAGQYADDLGSVIQNRPGTAYGLTAGEREAFEVGDRANMSIAKRAGTAPKIETDMVKYGDMIYRYDPERGPDTSQFYYRGENFGRGDGYTHGMLDIPPDFKGTLLAGGSAGGSTSARIVGQINQAGGLDEYMQKVRSGTPLDGPNLTVPRGQLPDITQDVRNGKVTTTWPDRAQRFAQQVPGFFRIAQYLLPKEVETMKINTARDLVDTFRALPFTSQEMASVAFAGRAKRGWYENSGEAIINLFGVSDAPRFTALLAAMSPQTSVESNLANALRVWTGWVRNNRTPDPAAIKRIMGENVQGEKGEESVLGAWFNNAVTALTDENPLQTGLSGSKVDSFLHNLLGYVDRVTNDAWMSNYSGGGAVPGSVTGDTIRRVPVYLSMSAKARQAADILSQRTGQNWTGREIQETVWSWAKALYEMRAGRLNIAEAGHNTRRILEFGMLKHGDILTTPDFGTLFTERVYREILEGGGFGGGKLDEILGAGTGGRGPAGGPAAGGSVYDPEGSGIAGPTFEGHLGTAAARLERLYQQRLREKQATIAAEGK